MKIFLIGFMGSGKSYWGRQLSEKLGMRFFDLDDQITEQAGKSIAKIFETEGEEHFRKLEKETLHIIAESHDNFIMACGGGTPCYLNNIEYLKNAGTTVWINPPLSTISERLISEKESRPVIKSIPDEQLHSFIVKKFADRKIFYEQAMVTIDNDPIQLEQIIEKIFHA